jgi:crotonobetainyl-CoA:carnitine CoA-transferase CaiB-like acyl-CoA transferase
MTKLALKGLRVIDLSWVVAGPFATKILSDMGAEVIKIESYGKLDGLRLMGPWKGSEATPPNRSLAFDTKHVNKLSLLLNLRSPAGVEVFKKLASVSDIILENFRAGTMDKFGLGYSELKKVNPHIVMISLSGFGQTGPYKDYVSFGPNLQAISCLTSLTGWPGRTPVGIGQAYPDFIGGLFAVFAVLSYMRNRSSDKGAFIDLSQYEGTVSVLGHSALEYTVNNRIPVARGNTHAHACPHGCYRCKGTERWCVIGVYTDEEWQAFCNVIGNPDWTKSPDFLTFSARKEREEDLNRLVEDWTLEHSPEDVMEKMQAAGVPAGVVQNIEDLMSRDPHIKARGYYEKVDHPPIGEIIPEGNPIKLSLTPGSFRTPAPLLGEHNEHILKSILGISQEEIDRLTLEGAFE